MNANKYVVKVASKADLEWVGASNVMWLMAYGTWNKPVCRRKAEATARNMNELITHRNLVYAALPVRHRSVFDFNKWNL